MTDNPRLGPKMKALPNDRWREFVMAFNGQGRRHAGRAYAIGFNKHAPEQANANRVAGFHLLHDERIQAAILEVAECTLRSMASLPEEVWREVAENPQAAPGARVQAANAIADRVGLHAVTEHKTTVTHIGDDADRLQRIVQLAGSLGISPDRLLGRRVQAPMIDVTPEPVAVEQQEPETW